MLRHTCTRDPVLPGAKHAKYEMPDSVSRSTKMTTTSLRWWWPCLTSRPSAALSLKQSWLRHSRASLSWVHASAMNSILRSRHQPPQTPQVQGPLGGLSHLDAHQQSPCGIARPEIGSTDCWLSAHQHQLLLGYSKSDFIAAPCKQMLLATVP